MTPPRLFGLSDLHVGHPANRDTLQQLPHHPYDWVIAAGDLGETEEHLRWALDVLRERFARVVWVPGNHELWTMAGSPLRGLAKYERMVEICRSLGVLTPEDPYEEIPGLGLWMVPLFLLYDYSFCPPGMTPSEAIAWAAEDGIVCVDEHRLHPDPYPSRQAWCAARVAEAERRLSKLPTGARTVLVNHWPLRHDVCRLPRIPRFTPWCGTTRTNDWHLRFGAALVVSGHLHLRATDWRDGVRFEEISLGYPRQWKPEKGAPGYLRQVWPATLTPAPGEIGPIWHR
ncbi:MAG: metallophosphoesterase [Alphaproteobacteria bacterium]|nr:metallophosphoesterase [Alphaproteobacteria bacterium]MCB9695553.1 metallophosphoesterase [Alphaproteobacteria bacterium]